MSVFDHMAWAKRQRTGSVGAKAVLMALAERTGDEPVCFPSQALLAAETEQSERTVRTHLRGLEDLGLIASSRRYVDSMGDPLPRGKACNQYRLILVPAGGQPCGQDDQPANIAGGQPCGQDDQPANPRRPTGKSASTNRQPVAGEVPSEVPVTEPLRHPPGEPARPANDTKIVFDRWREVTGHPRAVLDSARVTVIGRALRSHGLDTTIAAVEGVTRSPFHTGDNPRGIRYDGLAVILRNAESIEKFASLTAEPPVPRDPLEVLTRGVPSPASGSVPFDSSQNPVVVAQRRRSDLSPPVLR